MSDNLIIHVISVIKMSMQSFTRLVGIGSIYDDLHGVCRTRRRISSAMTQLRFCKTFLVSGGFSTHECEPEGKKEGMIEILLVKNVLNVFARATIEE